MQRIGLTELAGQRVRCRHDGHAASRQLRQQAGDQHGVARVVEFEFVDAQDAVVGQLLDGLVEAEAPTTCVNSTNVPNALGDGTLWKIEARRWVLPTPKPPSR